METSKVLAAYADDADELTESRRDEDLRVGDVVLLWCGAKRITAIEPYRGPLAEVFALAEYTPGASRPLGGFSLLRGGYTEVVVRGVARG